MTGTLDMAYPFTGRWLVQNSPGNRVPSHGTARFASSYAIDFVPVDDNGHTAPVSPRTFVRPEPPETFPGFGRTVLSPVDGTVVAVHGGERDHPAYRGLPSVRYALSQGRRAAAGWVALAGNHILIESDGIIVALCHLRHGSLSVTRGQLVDVGAAVAECGNTGNSTEPHLHLQAVQGPDVARGTPVVVTFHGVLPRNGDIV
jgi:hypothetical protein